MPIMFRPLLISLCLTSTALATTWTVDDDGKADFDNIQDAIDAASDGDEIIVMEGMYYEHDINTLGKSILIEGSINTAGELLAVVHGNWQGSVFVCDSGETTSTVLKNLLITGGNALSGSGMYIEESAPSLVGCTFMNNYAIKGLGGGMHNWGSSPTLTNCTFTGNAAGGSGGGMYNENSSPTLTNCTFTANTATDQGGGMYNRSGDPTLENCTFENNTATSCGGGIANRCNWTNYGPTLTNCSFIGNNSYAGGGFYNEYGNCTLIYCTFNNNSAYYGGGMLSGGVQGSGENIPNLSNCTFINNTAANSGGGLYNQGGCRPLLTDCTFENNTAATWGYGGGIYNHDSFYRPTLTDTTVCGNTPDQIHGNWINNGGNTVADVCPYDDTDGDGVVDDVDNCYLYNPDQADCNENGIGDVCDVDDGTSIDVNGNGIPDECEVDCNSNAYPDEYDIKMGWSEDVNGDGIPDECQCIADLDNDGEVNVNELLWIISVWGTSLPAFDINDDGIVDVSDLLIVVGNWGPCE